MNTLNISVSIGKILIYARYKVNILTRVINTIDYVNITLIDLLSTVYYMLLLVIATPNCTHSIAAVVDNIGGPRFGRQQLSVIQTTLVSMCRFWTNTANRITKRSEIVFVKILIEMQSRISVDRNKTNWNGWTNIARENYTAIEYLNIFHYIGVRIRRLKIPVGSVL